MNEFNIDILDEDISLISKWSWKKYVKEKVQIAALKYLVSENESKEKTKHIKFHKLKISDYLLDNEKNSLSKTILSIRSQTLDIKEWQPWKYEDNLCIKCEVFAETMDHLVNWYGNEEETENNWREIFEDSVTRQKQIGRYVQKIMLMRQEYLDKQEAGQTSDPAPILQLR